MSRSRGSFMNHCSKPNIYMYCRITCDILFYAVSFYCVPKANRSSDSWTAIKNKKKSYYFMFADQRFSCRMCSDATSIGSNWSINDSYPTQLVRCTKTLRYRYDVFFPLTTLSVREMLRFRKYSN